MQNTSADPTGLAAIAAPMEQPDLKYSSIMSNSRTDVSYLAVHDRLLDLCPTPELLQQLIESAQIDDQTKRDKLSRSLLRAASYGDMDMLSYIFDPEEQALQYLCDDTARASPYHRSDINFNNIKDEDGTGPVILAACAGHIDAVALLLANGAPVDERDGCGWTPLMWAINSTNLPLVTFLLSRGADVELKTVKGTSCEDFILSAAPEFAGTSQLGSYSSSAATGSRKGLTTDSQTIADLIHEHQRYLFVQETAPQRLAGADSPTNGRLAAAFDEDNDIAVLQRSLSTANSSTSPFKPSHSRSSSQLTSRRLIGRYERANLVEKDGKRKELHETRKSALRDISTLLGVNYSILLGELISPDVEPKHGSKTFAHRRKGAPKVVHADLASGCGAAEVGADPLTDGFLWNTVRSDQMLVVGPSDVVHLLDMMFTNYMPVRAPWTSRTAPANILFLSARYACHVQDEDLLDDLFLGAFERVEGAIYSHPTDMTYLAYWLSNCCLLRHYILKDRTLRKIPSASEYNGLIADLLDEIHVFIIRDAERRIDKVLDAAMLDHEAIPGLDDIRFEGEWKFMKTLTGSVKGLGQSNTISQGMSPGGSSRTPISQIFGSRRDDSQASMPSSPSSFVQGRGSYASGSSTFGSSSLRQGAESPTKKGQDSFQSLRELSYSETASELLSNPTPRTITSLLTSTLQILQLYEVNPAIIVQALSQIFFWIGCELFNRVLSRKRYLCRSRAIQVRMNVSALEDWARNNALPLSIVHCHLAPLSQLISWLQCQSSLQDFDGLIATMQGLKALTPIQLRRAVKDYRYEIGETRMSTECLQYLDQLIIDWKRRQDDQLSQLRAEELIVQQKKKQFKLSTSSHHRSGTATQNGRTPDIRSPSPDDFGYDEANPAFDADTSLVSNTSADTTRVADAKMPLTAAEQITQSAQDMIDGLFATGKSIADYVPPWTAAGPPLALHEDASISPATKDEGLLNSRDMLPFALPTNRNALIVTPGDSFGFGRGHFTGTGTPSLRSVNGDDSGSEVPSQFSSRRSSIVASSRPASPASASEYEGSVAAEGDDEDDKVSTSGLSEHSDISGISRASSLFPQGKGLAAGGYWNPVPLLPDDLLDKIGALMRDIASNVHVDRAKGTHIHDPAKDAQRAAVKIPTRASSSANFRTPKGDDRSGILRDSYFPADDEIDRLMGHPSQSQNLAPYQRKSALPTTRNRSEKQPSLPSASPALGTTDEFGRRDDLDTNDATVRIPGPHRQDTLKASTRNSSGQAYKAST